MDLKAGSAVRRRSPVALFTRLRFADVAASGMTEMLVSGKKERVRARAGPNNIVGRAAQPRCVFGFKDGKSPLGWGRTFGQRGRRGQAEKQDGDNPAYHVIALCCPR